MSITFWIPSAPKLTTDCEYCEWEQEHHGEEAKCMPTCPGTREISSGPECNFSNTNALGVLELLGVEPDYCGGWSHEDLPAIQQRLLVTLNKPSERAWLDRDTEEGGGDGSCKWVICGNTDDQTLRRLNAVQRVVTYAQKNGFGVDWG